MKVLVLVPLLLVSALASAFGPQSSTKAQAWGFDFVEEFDGLQDWNMSPLGAVGNQWSDTNATQLARMPKLADGSRSAWDYFSLWGDGVVSTHAWIGGAEGGSRRVWRGEKSAALDLGRTAMGPSRLGLHFGREYRHLSLFYMVHIPKANFPTSCIERGCTGGGPIGVYQEGLPYTYYASWKFGTFNIGCDGVTCRSGTYGLHWLVPHIKQYNYTPFGLIIQAENNHDSGSEVWRGIEEGVLNQHMGGWFGVEFGLRHNSDDSSFQIDVWTYAPDGSSQHVLRDKTFHIRQAAHGRGWDHFLFGGNNSNSWTWGPSMTSHYYVDDLIIDDGSKGRIGPRYFEAIGVLGMFRDGFEDRSAALTPHSHPAPGS